MIHGRLPWKSVDPTRRIWLRDAGVGLGQAGMLHTVRGELSSWEKCRTMLEAAGDAVPDLKVFTELERFHE